MMKTFLILFFLTISSFSFSQNVIVKLLNSSEKEVIEHMQNNLKEYSYRYDSLAKTDTLNVRVLEFILNKDSIETGILVYLFYFQSPYIDKCTSIRLIFYDELKFKKSFQTLTKRLHKINIFQWYDAENNLKVSTFYAKDHDVSNVSYYFMDIEPYN